MDTSLAKKKNVNKIIMITLVKKLYLALFKKKNIFDSAQKRVRKMFRNKE